MKRFTQLFLLFGLLISFSLSSQVIPNGDFELWETNSMGGQQPVNWVNANSSDFSNIFEVAGEGGGSACEFRLGMLNDSIVPASMFVEFQLEEKYNKIRCSLKGNPLGNSIITITSTMFDASENVIGFSYSSINQADADFELVLQTITYTIDEVPTSCAIIIVMEGDTENSSFTIDNMELIEASSAIGEMNKLFTDVGSVYPSPVRDRAEISFNLVEPAQISIEIIDLSGSLVFKQPASDFNQGVNKLQINLQGLASGFYFCSLIPSDGIRVSRKIVIE